MGIQTSKLKMNRNLKFEPLLNLNNGFYSSTYKKSLSQKTLCFNKKSHLLSFPKENKWKIINNQTLNLTNTINYFNNIDIKMISNNINFLKFIEKNPNKGMIARTLIEKMKKKKYFAFPQKSNINNNFKQLTDRNLLLNEGERTIDCRFKIRKTIFLIKNQNKIEINKFKEKNYNNIYDSFKNEFIREKMKKSMSSQCIV